MAIGDVNFNNPFDPAARAKQESDAEASNIAQGFNSDGSPKYPTWDSALGDSGLLGSQYQANVQGVDPNSLGGMSAMKTEALRTGPSAWGNIMLQKQQADRANAMSQATGSAAQGLAMGRSSLAMRGGLSSGARERLATNSIRDLMAAKQGVNANAMQNQYGLLGQDEQNRLANLNAYAGQETGLAQFNKGNELNQNQFNITKALEERNAQRQNTQNAYQMQLKKWGAEHLGQAMS